MEKREFKITGLGEVQYILYVENNILHIKAKKEYEKHSTYRVLKGDIKHILSALDTIEYVNGDSQKFNIGYQDKNIIFYLIQEKYNLHKNILEFKATLIDRKEI